MTELLPCPHIFPFRRVVTRLSDFSSLPGIRVFEADPMRPTVMVTVYPLL